MSNVLFCVSPSKTLQKFSLLKRKRRKKRKKRNKKCNGICMKKRSSSEFREFGIEYFLKRFCVESVSGRFPSSLCDHCGRIVCASRAQDAADVVVNVCFGPPGERTSCFPWMELLFVDDSLSPSIRRSFVSFHS